MRVLKLKKIKLDKFQKQAAQLCKKLQLKARKTFWVGGAVRQMLLAKGDLSKNLDLDIDMATEATPRAVKRMLNSLGIRFFDVGEKFGTIGAILPVAGGGKDKVAARQLRKIEITTFRVEQDYLDFRHPDKVKFISIPELDAKRRDFTINAMMFDPAKGEVSDFFTGLEDLKAKKIRFVGEAGRRIKEDPLRMLRAVRFATILNFKINPKDFLAIKKHAKLIGKIAGQRIKQELDKIVGDINFVSGIKLLDEAGLLKEIFPELHALKKVQQSKDFHAEGNAFKHSLRTAENLKGAELELRYAALLHDIGKAKTSHKGFRNGRAHVSFHGHAKAGAEMFKRIAKIIVFTKDQSRTIYDLILHHMDFLYPDKISKATLDRWNSKLDFTELIKLRVADNIGSLMTDKRGKVIKENQKPWLLLMRRLKKAKSKPSLAKIISGHDVMRVLKIKPGKEVGKILGKVLAAQKRGKIKNKKQGITFLKSLDNKK